MIIKIIIIEVMNRERVAYWHIDLLAPTVLHIKIRCKDLLQFSLDRPF